MSAAFLFWPMIWAGAVGGGIGFMAACVITSRAIYQAHIEGYQEACDDAAEGRIFDGVRWKIAEPENLTKPTTPAES